MSGFKSKQAVNRFIKGMNLDIDKSLMSSDTYRYAENFRLVTNKNGTTGTLENVDGNTLIKTFSEFEDTSITKVIAYNIVRDYLVLFTATTDDNTSFGGIHVYRITGDTIASFRHFTDTSLNKLLNFKYSSVIKSVGRYENDSIIKVYFVDGINTCRYVNIMLDSSKFTSLTSDDIDFIPSATLEPALYKTLVDGNLKAGKIQYAYQLFDTNGAETTISIASNLINLTKSELPNATNNPIVGYIGTDIDDNTNKGVVMRIAASNSLSKFDNIRVYSIHYTQINQQPTINVILEEPVSTDSNGDFVFTDTGNIILDTLTLDEFTILSSVDLVAKDIETKNNILFLANTKEKRWDIDLSTYDTRCYRFTRSDSPTLPSTTILKGKTNTNKKLNTLNTVSKTHDCINEYNIINKNTAGRLTTPDLCAFNSNDVLGGNGRNIDFEFVYSNIYDTTINNGDNSLKLRLYNTGLNFKGFEDITNAATLTGFQRDEVYRFGIVFYNNKNQVSPVSWIADIKTPSVHDSAISDVARFIESGFYSGDGNDKDPYYYIYKTLGIRFTVRNLATLKNLGVTGFEIVRVKRTTEDKSIISQGITTFAIKEKWDRNFQDSLATPFFPTMRSSDNGINGYISYNDSTLSQSRVALFTSPETVYNKDIDKQEIQFVEALGIYDYSVLNCGVKRSLSELEYDLNAQLYITSASDWGFGDYARSKYYSEDKLFLLKCLGFNSYSSDKSNVNTNDLQLLKYEYFTSPDYAANRANMKVYSFSNSKVFRNIISHSMFYANDGDSGDWDTKPYGFAGTKLGFTVSEDFLRYAGNTKIPVTLCNLRKTNGGQYGGNTYSARQLNNYISCGAYRQIGDNTSITLDVYGGDTYVSTFECLWAMSDQTNNYLDSAQVILFIPCETSINLKYTHGSTWHNKESISTKNKAGRLHEKAGVFGGPDHGYVVQDKDYYLYNSVYSQENTTKVFVTEKYFENKNEVNDTRIHYSDTKINSELVDSWLKFRALNFLDIDPQYGSVNNISTFGNQLYFWQDKAFGWVSVKEREILSATNTTNLVLGTGGILDRYDYLSTVNGCINNTAICNSDATVYWFDGLNKEICGYSGKGVEKLSKTKGVQTWLNTLNTFTKSTKVDVIYDQKFNEIYYYLDNTKDKVLIYSESIEMFIGFNTYNPDLFIDNKNITYSIKDNKLYKHNTDNKAEFYGNKVVSYIKLLINDQYATSKVFDSLEYQSNSTTLNSNSIFESDYTNNTYDTFNTIKCYNDYQNTDTVDLINKLNYQRKERSFTISLPRNSVNKSIDNNIFSITNLTGRLLHKERLLDKYLYIDLKYNNTDGNVLNLPYLITNYRVSIR